LLQFNHWSVTMHYLTFRAVQAKLGGRGRTTIYRDVELGRLPKPVKIGGRLYWAEADIDAAIAAHAG
jgi:predicted DNA-binding transcriptional regulator AlpA